MIARYYVDMPTWANDRIYHTSCIRLSWRERLLLLFRPLVVSIHVDTENLPGHCNAEMLAHAARWRWPWQRRGYLESRSEDQAKSGEHAPG